MSRIQKPSHSKELTDPQACHHNIAPHLIITSCQQRYVPSPHPMNITSSHCALYSDRAQSNRHLRVKEPGKHLSTEVNTIANCEEAVLMAPQATLALCSLGQVASSFPTLLHMRGIKVRAGTPSFVHNGAISS
eukprot:2243631-Amphidinium_carterae.1